MKLILGSHVGEHGRNVGRLAGFELEPADLRIRRIIISPDGELGPQSQTRTLSSIGSVDDRGTIQLRANFEPVPLPAVSDVALLSPAVRIRRGDAVVGRLSGIDVDPDSRAVLSVSGRQRWWSRRFTLARSDVDASNAGEIRVRTAARTEAA